MILSKQDNRDIEVFQILIDDLIAENKFRAAAAINRRMKNFTKSVITRNNKFLAAVSLPEPTDTPVFLSDRVAI